MNYAELLESNEKDKLDHTRERLIEFTDKQLAAIVNNGTADVDSVNVAKQLLIERGVQGVPE